MTKFPRTRELLSNLRGADSATLRMMADAFDELEAADAPQEAPAPEATPE